jgi:uncharacterized protein YcaQ
MIEKQGITQTLANPTKDTVYNTIDHLGCLQIDTINVIERAHYLTLWSRLGNYEKKYLDSLTYEDKKLFEYIAHAACFIPFKDYRYYIHAMQVRKKELLTRLKKRTGKGQDLIDHVLTRIKQEGPLASKDFDSLKKDKSGWWNRKDEKIAMDYLYGAGILSIDKRVNFQRYYDLTENIIPSWIDTIPPSDVERIKYFIEKTMECLGLIHPQEARKYFHHFNIKLGQTSSQIETLLNDSKYNSIDVDGITYYCLSEDYERLESIDDDFDFDKVCLLNYFDNFMWNRKRIQRLFGFESKLEIYIPIAERVYGYYHLPILYGDQFVARIEPKMDRKENKFLITGYWTEPDFEESEDYRDKLIKNLEALATFHGTKNIEWLR